MFGGRARDLRSLPSPHTPLPTRIRVRGRRGLVAPPSPDHKLKELGGAGVSSTSVSPVETPGLRSQ